MILENNRINAESPGCFELGDFAFMMQNMMKSKNIHSM